MQLSERDVSRLGEKSELLVKSLIIFNECSLVFIDIHKMTCCCLGFVSVICLLLIIVYHGTLNDIFYTIFVLFPCASNL